MSGHRVCCRWLRIVALFRVILLPGSVLPADLAYGSLVSALGSDAEAVVKELEVYATAEVPPDYTLDLEVVRGAARSRCSAGGRGSIWPDIPVVVRQRWHSLLATRSGCRVSRCWSRPGPATGISAPPSRRCGANTTGSRRSPPDQLMRGFMRLQVRPGVELPPPPPGESAALDGEAARGIRGVHADVQDV